MADKAEEALKAIQKLESRVSALESALKNKKDIKPEHEKDIKAALKQASEVQAMVKDNVTKVIFEARFSKLEAMINSKR